MTANMIFKVGSTFLMYKKQKECEAKILLCILKGANFISLA